jgi:hypothetical protein
MKEDFRKLEIQMKQKEKQYQDAVTQKVLLQQQVRVHVYMRTNIQRPQDC